MPSHLFTDEEVPLLECDEKQKLDDEEATGNVLVDGVGVGRSASEETEGHEGRQKKDQREDHPSVTCHFFRH